jgi:hypothetical protein
MAKLPCFLFFGQSNMEGAAAIGDIPAAVTARWLGSQVVIPGINMWQAEMPHTTAVSNSANVSGTAAAGSTATALVISPSPVWTVSDAALVGLWGVITSGALKGVAFKVVSNTADTLTITSVGADPTGLTFVVYSGGTQSLATYAGAFKQFNFAASAASTYTTGYEYPAFRSFPRSYPGYFSVEQYFGPPIEALWQLANRVGQDVWGIQLAVPAAGATRSTQSILLNPNFSWYDNALHNDWHPYSTSKLTTTEVYDLFDILIETILKGAATTWVGAHRAGDTLDVQGIFIIDGETDAEDEYRAGAFYDTMKLIKSVMRQRIADAGLSSRPANRIPFIMGGVKDTSWAYGSSINAALQKLADADEYAAFVDVNDLDTKVGSPEHFDSAGCVEIGKRLVDAWSQVLNSETEAIAKVSSLKTLSQLTTLVKRRYEASGDGNDATSIRVTDAINYALREVYDTLGDDCWFLLKSSPITITAGASGIQASLPSKVNRPLWIESQGNPGRQIKWAGAGYDDEGNPQIVLMERTTGPFQIHYILSPDDLATDDDVCLAPPQCIELIVLLACLRIAETARSADQMGLYTAMAQRRWLTVQREALRYKRSWPKGMEQPSSIEPYSRWEG